MRVLSGKQRVVKSNRIWKGVICLSAIIAAAGFHGVQSAGAETVEITTESGSWDDIQGALNSSKEDPDNLYVIKVPKGTHKIEKQLYVPGNTTLDLRGVTLKSTVTERELLILGDLSKKAYNGGKNIKILGGTLDAGTQPNSADICRFSHVQNVTFSGTVFKYLPKKKVSDKMRNTHMIEFAASKNVLIEKCKFYNNSNCRSNNEAVQLESAQNEKKLIATTPDLGKRDGTQCSNITIKGCYFKGFNYGCGSNHLSNKDRYNNMKFIMNTFVGSKKYAICLFRYKNVLISGNKLKNCGALYQDQGSQKVKVKK